MTIIKETICFLLRLFFIFPINKRRIIFYSFGGTQYSCSPMYISNYLAQHYPDKFQLIWAVNDLNNSSLMNTPFKIVKYNSLAFIYYRLTSAIIITNDILPTYFPYRKKQMNINTWHGGGCYKKTRDFHNLPSRFEKAHFTHFLSSCQMFSEEELKKEFHFVGEILPIGLPRNDIFFSGNKQEIRCHVREKMCIPSQVPIIFYAPTWRSEDTAKFLLPDFELIKKVYQSAFHQEPVVMVRAHHGLTAKIAPGDWIDATPYPDVQELLVAADMLITDYSSIVWDYSFTGKPCFLFTPDLDDYRRIQGFHIDIEKWGFPICKNTEELADAILHFDPVVFSHNMNCHHEMFGSYEKGNACEKLSEFILSQS